MPTPELIKQVAEELKEIQNAPPIAYGPTVPTCHFTGRILKTQGELVEVRGIEGPNGGEAPVNRFKGG
jgi:hypothetical protein